MKQSACIRWCSERRSQMICPYCNSDIPDRAKFCPECGSRLVMEMSSRTRGPGSDSAASAAGGTKRVKLICRACNGTMEVDREHNVIFCPYCGSKELIIESDEVLIEKDRNQTYKDIEMQRLQHEEDMMKAKIENESIESFKKSCLRKWVILFSILALLTGLLCCLSGHVLTGIVAFLQTGVFVTSWIFGMGTLRAKRKNLHRLLALIGFLMMIIIFAMMGNWSQERKNVKYDWPTAGLATMIPQPDSKFGKIYRNTSEAFDIDVYRYPNDQLPGYISECKDMGFTVDAKSENDSYSAYDENGNSLKVSYYSYSEQLNITVEAPIDMQELDWEGIDAVRLLPKPKSTQGHIQWEYSGEAQVYIGDTSLADFNEYVKACKKAGFNQKISRGDDYYYAYYKQTEHYLSLRYEGNKIMSVHVSHAVAPVETDTETPANTEVEASEKTDPKASEDAKTGT